MTPRSTFRPQPREKPAKPAQSPIQPPTQRQTITLLYSSISSPSPQPIQAMATANWRTINIDLLDPDSPSNFSLTSLLPTLAPVSLPEVQSLSSQIRQLLRGGDTEGALRGALENAPYGGDAAAKVRYPLRSGNFFDTSGNETLLRRDLGPPPADRL